MIQQIAPAIAVIGQALDSLAESPLFTLEEKRNIVQSNISCQEKGEVQWHQGEELFKYLKNVSVNQKNGGPPIEFNTDGSLKPVEIRIVNLQVDDEAMKNNAQNSNSTNHAGNAKIQDQNNATSLWGDGGASSGDAADGGGAAACGAGGCGGCGGCGA